MTELAVHAFAQPGLGGQYNSKFALGHGRQHTGKNVVVGKLQLVHRYGVIFVHNRQYAAAPQGLDTGENVEIALAMPQIVAGEQQLSGEKALGFACVVIQLHQSSLA
ncbi:hypothetical protein SDC9_157005 [bioreactor metagenome]|uniref:Uncharacterized protein n=1 Tax=bioreactor metagenome TaxID=1076179 RepID=A0A645FB94_9ZZZZ